MKRTLLLSGLTVALGSPPCWDAVSVDPAYGNSHCRTLCETGADDKSFYKSCRYESVKVVTGEVFPTGACFDTIEYGGPSVGTHVPVNLDTPAECQEICQSMPDCAWFVWTPESPADGHSKDGVLSTSGATCIIKTMDEMLSALEGSSCDPALMCDDGGCLECQDKETCVAHLPGIVSGPVKCGSIVNFCHPDQVCEVPLDVLILQDLSYSVMDDKSELQAAMRPLLWSLDAKYPDSRFALASFIDKPVDKLGYPGDYCWWTHEQMTGNVDVILNEVDRYIFRSGRDWPENQLEALYHAGMGSEIAWPVGDGRQRLVILLTDSVYHIAGHGAEYGLKANDLDANIECDGEDYPLIEDVASILQKNDVIPIILASNDPRVAGVDVPDIYKELMDVMGIPGVAIDVDVGYGNLFTSVDRALRMLAEDICPPVIPDSLALAVDMLVDVSHSMTPEMEYLGLYIGEVIAQVQLDHDMQTGVGSFTDKPIAPFGWAVSGDYCFYREMDVQDRTSLEVAEEVLDIPRRSGRDMKEAQLIALMESIHSDWPTAPIKVSIVFTDALPHLEGDASQLNKFELGECETTDYPSLEKIASAIAENKHNVIFVVHEDHMDAYRDIVEYISVVQGITLPPVYSLSDNPKLIAEALVALADGTTPPESEVASTGRRLGMIEVDQPAF